MSQLSKDERTKVVQFYLETRSIVLVQIKFKKHFKVKRAPSGKTIKRLADIFLAEGSVSNRNTGRSGRKKSSTTDLDVREVSEVVSRTPKVSVRRIAQLTKLSKSSVHRILKKSLKLTAYKLSVCQSLAPADLERREKFCEWFLEQCSLVPHFLTSLWWSDEAHFHLHGTVNRQNVRFWGKSPPEEVIQVPLHSPKVTVWCALSAQGIIGPYFFEDSAGATKTITSDRYVRVLMKFWRALNGKCADSVNQQWFQQDGATAHTSRLALTWLGEHLGDHLISLRAGVNWPPRSPDLTPLDFYLWGYLKGVVYKTAPSSLEELKRAIKRAVRAIPTATCARVAEESRRRAEDCVTHKGGYLAHVFS